MNIWRRIYWAGILAIALMPLTNLPTHALDRKEFWERLLQRSYHLAIEDAKQAEAVEVEILQPVVPSNKQLRWRMIDGQPHVLMVTWTNWDGYDDLVGQTTTLSREIWLTPVPQVKRFVHAERPSSSVRDLRLEQYLGLSPNNGKTKWVEMWIKPEDLFRPCPDAEITDDRCDLFIPVDITLEHYQWLMDKQLTSYGMSGYPWTRLGYTFDWGALDNEVGANELVVREEAIVQIQKVQTTNEYFRVPRHKK